MDRLACRLCQTRRWCLRWNRRRERRRMQIPRSLKFHRSLLQARRVRRRRRKKRTRKKRKRTREPRKRKRKSQTRQRKHSRESPRGRQHHRRGGAQWGVFSLRMGSFQKLDRQVAIVAAQLDSSSSSSAEIEPIRSVPPSELRQQTQVCDC